MKQILPGRTVYERVMTFVGSGFCFGTLAPFAPGTFGSIPGVLLAFATTLMDWKWQIAVCLLLSVAAIPFCDVAERVFAKKDDGRIVADEWMLYPLSVIGIPHWQLVNSSHWWLVIVFFVIIRVMDIVKVPPARGLQRLDGGLGVVADDFAANLYSLGINWLVYWAVVLI